MMRNASTFLGRKSIAYSSLVRRLLCVVLACLFLASGLAQTPAPWFGTWALNFDKSSGNPGQRFKKVTTRIEPSGDGLKVIYDAIGVRGGITHMEWTGKFDGTDRAVQGVDYVLTNAYSRADDHSYRIVVKVDGVLAATTDVAVSGDGKTLTTRTTEKNAQGRTVTTTSVYDRR